MGMTMTQKILASAAGKESVAAGEFVLVNLSLVLGSDATGPMAIDKMRKSGCISVFDKSKIALVLDHFTPNKDIKSAAQCRKMREFAAEHGIENFFEAGDVGIEHVLIPEKGLVVAGDCVIGADSHTCTYGALGAFSTGVGSTDMAYSMATGKTWLKVPQAIRIVLTGKFRPYVSGKDLILHIIGITGVEGALYKSMEFTGEGMHSLDMDDRFTVANMVVEAGAKNGIFEVDEKTIEYIDSHCNSGSQKGYAICEADSGARHSADRGAQYLPDRGAQYSADRGVQYSANRGVLYSADKEARYSEDITIDLSKLEHTVAFPHLPGNARKRAEWGDISVDQVVIGSCTNGRFRDMGAAAKILKGKRVKKGLRAIIIPATKKVYLDALKAGFIEIFVEAGCVVSAPTCGPCPGGHMGVLDAGEKCVSTTNRNFVGRMGHPESEVYLASPEVAAASAITGRLTAPEEVM